MLASVAGAVVLGVVALAVTAIAPSGASRGAPAPPRMTPEDLYAAFSARPTGRSFDRPVTISVEGAGDVVLPTGRLVATDGFLVDGEPFNLDLTAGRHPVEILRVDFPDGDKRVAAAMVRFSSDDPVGWELALVPVRIRRSSSLTRSSGMASTRGRGRSRVPRPSRRSRRRRTTKAMRTH